MKSDDWSDGEVSERRDKIRDAVVRAAFERLVAYGIESAVFAAGPESHGYIKGFRFRDSVSKEWPFGFIANQGDLLFYLRTAGVRGLRATKQSLLEWFEDVEEGKTRELRLRIRNTQDAELVIEHVLSAWGGIGNGRRGIPDDITRQDVEQAIADLRAGKAPNRFGESVHWDLEFEGELFPPKRVLGVAARRVAGRVLTPNDFQGGEESKCHRILEELGFLIVPKGDLREARQVADDAIEEAIRERKDIPPTQRKQLIDARRGQGRFRRATALVEKLGCRITGVTDLAHLRASHVKPWSVCTDEERLDGHNGLLLAPHADHLFDQGFISFEDDGRVIRSPALDAGVLKAWGLEFKKKPLPFSAKQKGYLTYHRAKVFLSNV
jgi:hypothetical protein